MSGTAVLVAICQLRVCRLDGWHVLCRAHAERLPCYVGGASVGFCFALQNWIPFSLLAILIQTQAFKGGARIEQ